ncbi:probable xyloglucan galactosyltransferase GT17 [Syzygium oleosum]|uniref:probable xyloglucan galactosyltransferase GT17 n=1 Tax=Syzygium oleosum TaxID=219896 RepID=UPI0011D23FFA|nr:probable xyloglucan galactosyltransferase GT17 [Syzygium oleosum]
MMLRKLRHALPWTAVDKPKSSKHHKADQTSSKLKPALFLSSFFALWFLLLYFRFDLLRPDTARRPPAATNLTLGVADDPPDGSACRSRAAVYVHSLPPRFNSDLLLRCRSLNMYTDMCPHVSNRGLGRPIPSVAGIGGGGGGSWFATNQFIAEMIFHARLENHPCRVRDPALANLFYVPFYAGLHVSSMFRERSLPARDALAVDLAEHVQSLPTWQRRGGHDHFLVLGRTAWDFLRLSNRGPDFGANSLLDLPAVRNMSVLTVERQPWTGSNQHGIPYPSYFHPATSAEMLAWHKHVSESDRPHLFSFIGGPRRGPGMAAIRDELIRQCNESARCELVVCKPASPAACHDPGRVLSIMAASRFCLQAPGDSFTRRSVFDAVLAGCVPVFFSPHTAYTQYRWYLPAEPREYSVFVDAGEGEEPLEVEIEKVLAEIPPEEVERMRRRVVELIPRITYAHPNATALGFRDAVDVAVDALLEHMGSKLEKT